MPPRSSFALLALAVVAPSLGATGSYCPGTPLACVGAGSQTFVVAVGLPPRALGVLVSSREARLGPVFGSGRWCVADPRIRLGTASADEDGTAVVRLEGRPLSLAGSMVQVLWRDRFSEMTGATSVAHLPGG